MRKTKIVATIGPASSDPAVFAAMCKAGVNVARLNFSHGTHEEQLAKIHMIKKVREELDLPIAIMLDTKGPEVRTGLIRDGSVQLKPGDTFTLEQLLYGLMIPSGNDAANAIADHIAGSTDAFVEKMNAKAKELGATHTHFVNANGLHSTDHYTTAYDLYLIFNEALKLPLFCEIINAQSYTADYTDANGAAKQQVWKVGNWYLKGDREAPEGVTVLGGKTGTTQAAGYCLIMASDGDDGKEYISVVLKSANRPSLYDNMTEILTKISNK